MPLADGKAPSNDPRALKATCWSAVALIQSKVVRHSVSLYHPFADMTMSEGTSTTMEFIVSLWTTDSVLGSEQAKPPSTQGLHLWLA